MGHHEAWSRIVQSRMWRRRKTGQIPKPVGVSIQNGEWLFRFRNHEDDRNPSTIALGDHRRLQLNGQHGFGQRQFFLPDQMSAQELGNHLAERLGWQPLDENPAPQIADIRTKPRIEPPGFQDFSRRSQVILQAPVAADRDLAKRVYRGVLGREMAQSSPSSMSWGSGSASRISSTDTMNQLNQAVGRNRGFRLSDQRPTTTRVITSSRLWQQVLRRRQNRYCRTQLYIAVA